MSRYVGTCGPKSSYALCKPVLRQGYGVDAKVLLQTCGVLTYWGTNRRFSLCFQFVSEWFEDIIGPSVQARDVFIAFTVDQGGNIVNAIKSLGVEVVICFAHRLNTVVTWMLGISGSESTCRNPEMEKLIKKLAACVGKFSHSAMNNSELKNVQELQKTFSKVYELIRRNDTRWVKL